MRIIDIQTVTDQPKKIQAKIWFQNFAAIRNWTRGHGATLPVTCSRAIYPLEKSLILLIENFTLFKREWAYLYQNMSGKYRVTNLNIGTSKFEELKINRSHLLQYTNRLYVHFDERVLVELIQSTPETDDFFYPNGNFKNKEYELLSYITDKRLQGDGAKYLTPASELPTSETEGLNSLYVVDNCHTNLPAPYNDYVSRKDLEDQLVKTLLETDRYPIITLKGLGGIGKTSLALSVLNQIVRTNRFELILWFSSRDIDLTSDGAKPVKNNILDEDDVANEFAELIGRSDVKKQDKVQLLSKEMVKSSNGSMLFVFDNFETVKNPLELFTWIDTYIRHPNKVMITSRTSKNFKADYPIEISGMTDDECRVLIDKTAINLNISHLLTPLVVDKLLHESNGHPYVIKIFLGEIAKNKKVTEIKRVIASKDDILTALFRRTYGWLSPSAKRVFLTLCSWRSVVPQIALEAVLLREENYRIDVDEAVEELRMSSFIEVVTSPGDDEIFLSVPLAAAIFGRSELEVSPEKFAILSDSELLQEFGAAQQSDIATGIKSRIVRKFNTIAKRINQKKEPIERHLPTLEYIASKYPYAWTYLAALHEENNNVPKEQESLREFLKTESNDSLKKEVWQKLADSYHKIGDWNSEINALVEKCTISNSTLFDISEVANILNQYVQKQRLNLDSDIKDKITRKLVDVFVEKIDRSVTATDYSRLAWLYLRLNDEPSAIVTVRKGLSIDSSNDYCNKLAQKIGIE